jgi:hypothetical protein
MRVLVGPKERVLSLVSVKKPGTLRVIPEEVDEFEFAYNQMEPLKIQIGKFHLDGTPITAN